MRLFPKRRIFGGPSSICSSCVRTVPLSVRPRLRARWPPWVGARRCRWCETSRAKWQTREGLRSGRRGNACRQPTCGGVLFALFWSSDGWSSKARLSGHRPETAPTNTARRDKSHATTANQKVQSTINRSRHWFGSRYDGSHPTASIRRLSFYAHSFKRPTLARLIQPRDVYHAASPKSRNYTPTRQLHALKEFTLAIDHIIQQAVSRLQRRRG